MPERPSTYDFTSRKGRQKWLQLHVDTAAEAAGKKDTMAVGLKHSF